MEHRLSPEQRALADAAKRTSDQYNLHRVADVHGSIGKWFAVRLSDGESDGVLYDSKSAAVTHQHHNEDFYAFVQIGPWTMSPTDAAVFLDTNRRLYDKGVRLADPEHNSGGRDLIKRTSREDQRNQLRALFKGDRGPSNLIVPGSYHG